MVKCSLEICILVDDCLGAIRKIRGDEDVVLTLKNR